MNLNFNEKTQERTYINPKDCAHNTHLQKKKDKITKTLMQENDFTTLT